MIGVSREAGRHEQPWVKPTVSVAFEPFGLRPCCPTPSGSGESLGSLSVGKQAQKACPCPRLLNLNPFGVQNPSLDFLTPGVQPKIGVKIRPEGQGGRGPAPSGAGRGTRAGEGLSVSAPPRPVRAAIKWPSATALGDKFLAGEAPLGATERIRRALCRPPRRAPALRDASLPTAFRRWATRCRP